jgi:nitrogenase subunit NifH
LAKIPFDKDVVNAMIDEKTIVEYKPNSNIANIIKDAWEKLISFESL